VTQKQNNKKKSATRGPHAERREESMTLILDHAEAQFACKGYNGTTLASVAKVAGVDTPLIGYYFGDKEHLFAAVVRRRGPLPMRRVTRRWRPMKRKRAMPERWKE
jgi:AcrR family transcriptional regulator